MKIGVFSSPGGHLTEVLRLTEAFEGHDVFFVINKTARRVERFREYQVNLAPLNVRNVVGLFFRTWRILRKERPDVLVSTGAEIAVFAFWMAKILRIKTIFIEDLCRIDQPTITGRLVYPVADRFLTQHEELLRYYGEKARYEGGVL